MKLFEKEKQLKEHKDTRHYRCFCGIEFEGRQTIVDHMNNDHTGGEIYRETGRWFVF